MLFDGSIRAVRRDVDDCCVQIPSKPLPVAAVEPACGALRLGSASPVTAGADAGTGADATAGADAAAGALAEEAGAAAWASDVLPPPPPPPPHPASANEPNMEMIKGNLVFMCIIFFECGLQISQWLDWVWIFRARNYAIM